MALPATDDFNSGSISANWTAGKGAVDVNASKAHGNNAGVNENCIFWNADSFSNDQYSQVVYATSSNLYGGCGVRMSGTGGSFNGYIWWGSASDKMYLQKITSGGAGSTLTTHATPPALNDVLRLEISGTTLTGMVNGVTRVTFTDASFASGAAGLVVAANTGLVDDWEGGNLAGAAFMPRPNPRLDRAVRRASYY